MEFLKPNLLCFSLAALVVFAQPVCAEEVKLKGPLKTTNEPMTTKNSSRPAGLKSKSRDLFSDIDKILDGEASTKEPLKNQAKNIICSIDKAPVSVSGFRAYKLKVVNNTKRTILVSGNQISGTVGGVALQCVSLNKLVDKLPNPDGPKHKYVRTVTNSATALITIGSVSAMKDQLSEFGDVKKRYGFDEARREEQYGRFADRILYPGDTTTGIVYFKTGLRNLKSLKVRIQDFNNKKDYFDLVVSNTKN